MTSCVGALCAVVAALMLARLDAHQRTADTWVDPSPHQTRFVTVDNSVRLEVLDWGGSGRPIVLLGCYLSAHVYDDFAPKLTGSSHVYGVTRRGIGRSDRPPAGYDARRSATDVLTVIDSLALTRPLIVGHSCAGRDLHILGAQHPDRVGGLVYLDAAEDQTLKLEAHELPAVDMANLPPPKPAPPDDLSSVEAHRAAQRRIRGFAFPEAEVRELYAVNADGSLGESRLSPAIRHAITVEAATKPDYTRIRVPVLAIFRTVTLKQAETERPPKNEVQRAALKQALAAGRARLDRWQRDLRAGVPHAKIVELPGANLFMFLSNEADVLREIRAFAAGLR